MGTKIKRTILIFHTSIRTSWQDLYSGIHRFAQQADWSVEVVERLPGPDVIRDLMAFWKPAGVIAEGGRDDAGILTPQLFGRTPTVFLLCSPQNLPKTCLRVEQDAVSLGRIAARELSALAPTSYAFYGYSRIFWSRQRAQAYVQSLAREGKRVDVFTRDVPWESNLVAERNFRGRFVEWLKALPKPCGLFVAHDQLGDEVLQACRLARLKVPEEIAVLGVDNDDLYCEHGTLTLSSIRPNFAEGGYLAAALLARRIAEGALPPAARRRLFSACEVVRRQSTCRLPRANAAVSRALELIRLRACTGLRPKDLMNEIHCSRRLLELRFRELTGHSLQDEIALVRLTRVKELLARADVPIESIAARCGWKSAAQLRVLFKSVEGVSLRRWRETRFAK